VNRTIIGERVLGLPKEPSISQGTERERRAAVRGAAVVTGAASGYGTRDGAAVASKLGAEVVGRHPGRTERSRRARRRAPLRPGRPCADRREAVAAIGGTVDSLFNCAGFHDRRRPTDRAGQSSATAISPRRCWRRCRRRKLDRVHLCRPPGWAGSRTLNLLSGLLATDGFDAGAAWCDAHDDAIVANGYGFSKEAINAYVAWRGFQVASRVRINSIQPGPTDTPMMPSFVEQMGAEFFERFPKPVGRNSRPDEQAWALVMVNSPRRATSRRPTC
jgi:NAD(P)-dependent dehydrogenase (short-subunit alcohol dehydrogenase family)